MRHVFLSFFLLFALAAEAQQLFLQVGGGLARLHNAHRAVGAFQLSVGQEWEFDQHWSIAPALGYAGKGWEDANVSTPDLLYAADGTLRRDALGNPLQRTDADGNPMFSLRNRSYTTHYVQLDLPIHYYLRLGAHRYLRFTAGLYVAYGVGGRRRTRGDGSAVGVRKFEYVDAVFSDLSGARRFDLGMKAGIGYQLPSALTFGVELNYGMLPFNRRTEDFPKVGHNLTTLLSITYHFGRKKSISASEETENY